MSSRRSLYLDLNVPRNDSISTKSDLVPTRPSIALQQSRQSWFTSLSNLIQLGQTLSYPHRTSMENGDNKISTGFMRRVSLHTSLAIKRVSSFTQFIVRHYRIGFALTLTLELMSVVLSVILILDKNYKLFPVDFKGVPMQINTEISYLRYLAFAMAVNQQIILQPESNQIMVSPKSYPGDRMMVIYEADNVLTWERLKEINRIEELLTDSPEWKKWSLKDSHDQDMKPDSLLRYFDGSVHPSLNNSNLANFAPILVAAYSNRTLRMNMDKLIAKNAVISKNVVTSTLTMSVFTIRVGIDYTKFWLFLKEIIGQVEKDIFLALGSFLVIVFFVMIQTRSIFLTVFGIGSILTSFMWTNIVYRVLLDYRYFGIFHVMSIFIILGIGTDDLFVFYDMWCMTGGMDFSSLDRRFLFCYRHASLSMAITSITTSAAFAVNIFMPMYGIKTFAIFTSILVMINFLSAILFFPMCVLVYHKDIEPRKWPWSKNLGKDNSARAKLKNPGILNAFFKGRFHKLVTHPVLKWVFIICSTVLAVVSAGFASQLSISKKDVQYYRTGYNYQESLELLTFGFKETQTNSWVKVNILFGSKAQDLSSCPIKDYQCIGDFHFDDSLDLNPFYAQKALQIECSRLKNLSGHADLHIRTDEVSKKLKITCFLDNMNQFFTLHGKDSAFFKPAVNLSLPVSVIKYLPITEYMPEPNMTRETFLSGNFYRIFEVAVTYWLTNGYQGNRFTGTGYNSDLKLSSKIGMATEPGELGVLLDPFSDSMDGTRLKFFMIEIETNLKKWSIDYTVGLATYQAWETFTNDMMLAKSAVRGILLGAILAFIVLTLSTSNVILSALATINILLVVATFSGFIKIFGFSISVIESINLSLVTGLAVDYVVHLSESYHLAPHEDRNRKVRDMLEHMGVSVLSGAITTFGASIFMLFAEIYFFFQFGLFLSLTVLLSLFYSLFWFTPLLGVIGPEGQVGSLNPFYMWVREKVEFILLVWNLPSEDKKLSYSRSDEDAGTDRGSRK